MLNEVQQRALHYRELARLVFDEHARDVILQLAAECDREAWHLASRPVKLFDEV